MTVVSEKKSPQDQLPYSGKQILLVTKHGKEKVIAPLIEKYLGGIVVPSQGIDTDQLGAFTGEVARKDSPLETVRKKCLLGLNKSAHTIAIASEGSFGSHPDSPFISMNEELVLLMDIENDLQILGKSITYETNHDEKEVSSKEEIHAFCDRVGFPEHGINLQVEDQWIKGICHQEDLSKKLQELDFSKRILIQTDMRAMNNPSRMKTIQNATEVLISSYFHSCPNCRTPGFQFVNTISGLPCGQCNMPTKGVKYRLFRCQKCHFEQKKASEKPVQDPMFCDFCNP